MESGKYPKLQKPKAFITVDSNYFILGSTGRYLPMHK